LHHLEDLFRGSKRAFYSRFGDGDVTIMMGKSQKLHRFSPSLQAEMKEAFEIENPLYCKGLAVNYPRERGMVRGILAPFRIDAELQNFLLSTFDLSNRPRFESAVFLHYLAIFYPVEAQAFLDEFIRPKRKMFIGSIPRETIEKLIGPVAYYVATPARDSYHTMDLWWPEVLKCAEKVDMVIPATGMATRVVNKRLWHEGLEVQSFDIGSLVDAVDLLPTRKWIRLAGHRAKRVLLDQPEPSFGSYLEYVQREIRLKCYSAIKQF
jgi:hypothetical protein